MGWPFPKRKVEDDEPHGGLCYSCVMYGSCIDSKYASDMYHCSTYEPRRR